MLLHHGFLGIIMYGLIFFTNHPEKWEHHIVVDTPDGEVLQGEIDLISNDANEVIPSSHVVLLCLPGFSD